MSSAINENKNKLVFMMVSLFFSDVSSFRVFGQMCLKLYDTFQLSLRYGTQLINSIQFLELFSINVVFFQQNISCIIK